MFTGSGQWCQVESDREGLQCASQVRPTIAGKMINRAYFDPAGKLTALSVTTEDGQTMEFDPQQIAEVAKHSVEIVEAEPRSRTLGRGKFSTRG